LIKVELPSFDFDFDFEPTIDFEPATFFEKNNVGVA
jgi:hypothetical protein